MKRFIFIIFSVVILLVCLSGCNSSLPISALHINSGTIRLESDMTKRLSVMVNPQNANTNEVILVSENEFVAVCEKDSVCAVNDGETYIYAQTKDGKITSNRVKVIVSNEIFEVAAKIILQSLEQYEEELKNIQIKPQKASQITETTVTKLPDSLALTKLTEENSDDVVYITKSGTKYHKYTCSYAKNASPTTRNEAVSKGLFPCSKCNP